MVELVDHVDVDELAGAVPDLDAVLYTQTRTEGGGEEEVAVRGPLADRAVAGVHGEDFALGEVLAVPDVDRAGKVAESCDAEESALRVEGDKVAWLGAEFGDDVDAVAEEDCLGRHVAVDDDELFRVGVPLKVVDGTLLVERHATVKVAANRHEVEVGLAVIRLAVLSWSVEVIKRSADPAWFHLI